MSMRGSDLNMRGCRRLGPALKSHTSAAELSCCFWTFVDYTQLRRVSPYLSPDPRKVAESRNRD
jgi:hypothetical protein